MGSRHESAEPLAYPTAAALPPVAGDGTSLTIRTAARSLQGMQKEALVCGTGPGWRLLWDEGPWLNGTDLAPFPLAFFTAGVAAAGLSAFLAVARQRGVAVPALELTVDNHYSMEGSATQGTMTGSAHPAELDFAVAADTDPDTLAALACAALAASPADSCLRTALSGRFALVRNGLPVPLAGIDVWSAAPATDPAPLFTTATPIPGAGFAADILRKLGGPEAAPQVPAGPATGVPLGLRGEQKRRVHVRGTACVRADGLYAIAVRCIRPAGSLFELLSDDAGGARAPSALAYLSAGVAFCFMTQLGRYASIVKQRVDAYRIVQDTTFVPATGATGAAARPVDTQVFVDGEEPAAGLSTLVRMGAQTCYLHAAYRAANKSRLRCRKL